MVVGRLGRMGSILVCALACTLGCVLQMVLLAPSARAGSFVVVQGDRDAFDDLLVVAGGSTVVDTAGAFAPDPTAAGGVPSICRSGLVAGQVFVYDAYDVDFSSAPTGSLVPGLVGGDLADLDLVDVETPAGQGGANGLGTWGLDGGSGSTATRNALLIDFVNTPDGAGVGHFAADLLDFEAAAAFTQGELRLYDDGALVFSHLFDWGASSGNGAISFLGVIANPAEGGVLFDQVVLVLGDDGPGDGRFERWAADRFTFGIAVTNPEPGAASLFASGLLVLCVWRRRRRGLVQRAEAGARVSTARATKS